MSALLTIEAFEAALPALLVEAQRRVDDGHTRRRPEDGGAALEAIAVTLRMIGRVRAAIGDPRLAIRLPDGTEITVRETLAHTVACCLDALARAERDVGVDHGRQAARSAAVEVFTEPGGSLPHAPGESRSRHRGAGRRRRRAHDAHACPQRVPLWPPGARRGRPRAGLAAVRVGDARRSPPEL